ncbi:hypothetical protein, partial [Aquisalimonas sp.]|uniref:hypothetical protein n=1 Tax=Aquisalimonas sp. TaxID=1872621 RepID=UPI0025BAD5B4
HHRMVVMATSASGSSTKSPSQIKSATVVLGRAFRRRLGRSPLVRAAYVGCRGVGRDAVNVWRFGGNAPRAHMRIWVRPRDVEKATNAFNVYDSGRVIDGDWDLNTFEILDIPKFQYCRDRWIGGRSWQQLGVLGNNQESSKEIDRFDELDRLFYHSIESRRFKTRIEIDKYSFREWGGTLIHISRDLKPIFGCSGYHRMAIAKLAELDLIPAQLGCVHPEAIRDWKSEYAR